MDYIEMLEESAYRYEVMRRQIDTQEFLQECVAIAEGTNLVKNLDAIHEAAADKTQGFWAKFTAWIAGIWNRFVARAEKLFKNDIGFLTDNKEIILGKKMQDGTISMAANCDDCIKHLQEKNTVIFPDVAFMDDLVKRATAEGDAEANINQWRTDLQAYITNKKITVKNGVSFADACKAYYCPGENVEVKTSEINLADLYNFCMSANTFKDGLSKTKNNFDTWMKKAENAYNRKFKEISNQNIKNGGAQPAANANAQQNVKEESAKYESVYSVVFESYISEASVNFNTNAQNNQQTNGKYINRNSTYNNQRNDVVDAGNVKNSAQNNKDALKQNTANAKGDNTKAIQNLAAQNANTANAADKKAIKAFTTSVSNYCKIVTETVGTVLGAMCTGCEKVNREYMSIITAHVMSYTGKQDSTASNAGTVSANTTKDMNTSGAQNVTLGATPGVK